MHNLNLRLAFFFGLSVTVGFTATAGAAPWPRFRGPNGTGITDDKNIPVQWTEQNGVLWKTALPGTGNSSPVVWGDRLFLQSATGDGKERLLLCLNAADGKLLWSRSIPATLGRISTRSSLASSTPATDGERVYTMFWDGNDVALYAYDFQGTMLWNRNLGGFKSQHGAGASPIVFNEKVILANDQDGSSLLICLDAKTGKLVWEAPRKAFRACYSAPFLLEHDGAPAEMIVSSTAGVTSYNPQSGSENWHWTWTFDGMALRTVASPIMSQGIVFATSGDGSGARHGVAIQIPGGAAAKPSLLWEDKKNLPYVPGMLPLGDHLYWVNDRGIAGCTVAKTGKHVWNERLVPGGVTASPILIDGKVYVPADDGYVYIFQAAPTFKLLAKNRLGEPISASPAVADNRLFIRGKTHLFCIGKKEK